MKFKQYKWTKDDTIVAIVCAIVFLIGVTTGSENIPILSFFGTLFDIFSTVVAVGIITIIICPFLLWFFK